MYLQSKDKKECCGCTACVTICSKKCLIMEKDEYGFSFPKMKNPTACTSCSRCKTVCPIEKNKFINPNATYQKPLCFFGWHKDEGIRMASTSGAAFVVIAQACETQGFDIYYGVQYNNEMMAVYNGVSSVSELFKFTTSKYVQSDLLTTYSDILGQLKGGKRILFSGTPCQVEGLQNIVPQKYRDQIITVALVCHGVSSPVAYRMYLKEIAERYGAQVEYLRFRDKRMKNGVLSHRFTTIKLSNGECLADTENPYTLAFKLGLMHRESCSKCPYTTPYRSVDFTIGDFWGIDDYVPELKREVSKGISLIYVHTNRASRLLSEIQKRMFIQEETLEHSLHVRQQQLRMPFARNSRRDVFLNKVVLQGYEFEKVADCEFRRWRYVNYPKSILRFIANLIRRRKV